MLVCVVILLVTVAFATRLIVGITYGNNNFTRYCVDQGRLTNIPPGIGQFTKHLNAVTIPHQ